MGNSIAEDSDFVLLLLPMLLNSALQTSVHQFDSTNISVTLAYTPPLHVYICLYSFGQCLHSD